MTTKRLGCCRRGVHAVARGWIRCNNSSNDGSPSTGIIISPSSTNGSAFRHLAPPLSRESIASTDAAFDAAPLRRRREKPGSEIRPTWVRTATRRLSESRRGVCFHRWVGEGDRQFHRNCSNRTRRDQQKAGWKQIAVSSHAIRNVVDPEIFNFDAALDFVPGQPASRPCVRSRPRRVYRRQRRSHAFWL